MKILGPVRLTTFLLLVLVVGLVIGLLSQLRRELEITRELAIYRSPSMEGTIDALDSPVAVDWPEGTPLDGVLKQIRLKTTGLPKLKTGMPIYVDPNGLQEAEVTPTAPVKAQAPDATLPLKIKLQRALDPLGLAFKAQDGFLMITSKASLDKPVGDARDPYEIYRDVLD